MNNTKIITVGFNPVWDRTCFVNGIEWGDHKVITSQTWEPAGKAFNISKALAWMAIPSTAAGLWGSLDYSDLTSALPSFQDHIQPAFTVVPGRSRQNITLVDTSNNREMHLRSPETLLTAATVNQLNHDLAGWIGPQNRMVFAGSIPADNLQDECLAIIARAGQQCAEVIVDTSGAALKKVVRQGGIAMIKPNLEELSELLDRTVANDVATVVSAARQLCDRVGVVIVSLGASGAVAVTPTTAVYGRIINQTHRAVHTVGCGDFLLAGYVSMPPSADISQKLAAGIKAATARAWGLAAAQSWTAVQRIIEVEITPC